MAFLNSQDDKELENQQAQAQGQGAQASSAPLTNQGGGIVGSGGNVSTAGVGKGGAGGWTNIQSYLNANKDNHTSSKLLNDTAGGAFDADKQNLANQSASTLGQANAQVAKTLDKPTAQNYVNQAAGAYNYNGNVQGQAYNDATGKVKNAYNAQWEGPSSPFAYGLSADTQKYGAGVDPSKFSSTMDDLYREKSGQRLGGGMLELQRQLDSADTNLADTRTALDQRYKGLIGDVDKTVTDTNAGVSSAKGTFDTRKADLSSYLGTQKGADESAVNKRAGDLNKVDKAYQTQMGVQGAGAAPVRAAFVEGINDPMFYGDQTRTYTGGMTANANNATGVDTERNRFNTIMDVLGDGTRINKADPFHLGTVNVHTDSLSRNPEGSPYTTQDAKFVGDDWIRNNDNYAAIKNATGVDYFPGGWGDFYTGVYRPKLTGTTLPGSDLGAVGGTWTTPAGGDGFSNPLPPTQSSLQPPPPTPVPTQSPSTRGPGPIIEARPIAPAVAPAPAPAPTPLAAPSYPTINQILTAPAAPAGTKGTRKGGPQISYR
jgi:hypothetical protein